MEYNYFTKQQKAANSIKTIKIFKEMYRIEKPVFKKYWLETVSFFGKICCAMKIDWLFLKTRSKICQGSINTIKNVRFFTK
jgi:hypothetical protein